MGYLPLCRHSPPTELLKLRSKQIIQLLLVSQYLRSAPMQCGTAPLNRMHCRTVYAYLQYLTYTIQYKLSVAYKRNDRPSSLLRRSPCRSRPSYAHCRYTTCRRRWFFDLLCARFRNSYELHTSFDRLLVCSCLIVEPALPQLAIEV